MRRTLLISFACAVLVGLAADARARGWKFTRIVDTDTPIPGGMRTFNHLQVPSFDGQHVAFRGGRFVFGEPEQDGIYTDVGGLHAVADLNTPVPGGAGTFTSFGTFPTIDAGKVVFWGYGDVPGCNFAPLQEGIYTDIGGLHVVADTQTPVPGGNGNFRIFGASSVREGQITFVAWGYGGQYGVYSDVGGLHAVADTQTPVPGGSGNFAGFGSSSISGGHVVFDGRAPGRGGIYTDLGGLTVVADTTMTVPGRTNLFEELHSPAFDGQNVAFWGCIPLGPFHNCGFPYAEGIYSDVGGLHTVADITTPVPGGTGTFLDFADPAIDAGTVAFTGRSSSGFGVYLSANGTGSLEKVLAPNDMVDGRAVTSSVVGPTGMRGPSLAIAIDFSDGTFGLYRADLIDATVGIRGVPNPAAVGAPFTLRWSLRNAGAAIQGKLLLALATSGRVIPLGLSSLAVPAGADWRDLSLASFPYPQLPTSGWLLALFDATTGKLVGAGLDVVTIGGAASAEEERQIRGQADIFLKTYPSPSPR